MKLTEHTRIINKTNGSSYGPNGARHSDIPSLPQCTREPAEHPLVTLITQMDSRPIREVPIDVAIDDVPLTRCAGASAAGNR